MYLPKHFEETRIDVLHALIRAHPLGALVTRSGEGFEANHVPFEIDPDPAPFGTLRAHVARTNAVWREGTGDALVIFQGPDAYVSPSWYPSKRAHGKAVPTWNYAIVHAYGALRAIDDAAWLRAFVAKLADRHESARPDRWRVTDAPADYVDTMVAAIVGIELPIVRLVGKWKVSQNWPAADRAGVAAGLATAGGDAARAMAELVRGATT
jgi:transcriptional regulator